MNQLTGHRPITPKQRGAKAQGELNRKVEGIILEKQSQGFPYSEADRLLFADYTGAGGLGKEGAKGAGVLNEFYTPAWLVEIMWQLAKHWGFTGGKVLEPSCGIGKIIAGAGDKSEVVGFEMNAISAVIAGELNPKASIYNLPFETAFLNPPRFRESLYSIPKGKEKPIEHPDGGTHSVKGILNRKTEVNTWLKQYPFDLVIMNPPYGIHRNKYSAFFRGNSQAKMPNIESFFLQKSLQLLRPGGLLISLHPQNFLRNGITMNPAKKELGSFAQILDAHRLPPVFEFSNVPTDLIVLEKL